MLPNAIFTGKLEQINRQLDCSFKVNKCACIAYGQGEEIRCATCFLCGIIHKSRGTMHTLQCFSLNIFFPSDTKQQTTLANRQRTSKPPEPMNANVTIVASLQREK